MSDNFRGGVVPNSDIHLSQSGGSTPRSCVACTRGEWKLVKTHGRLRPHFPPPFPVSRTAVSTSAGCTVTAVRTRCTTKSGRALAGWSTAVQCARLTPNAPRWPRFSCAFDILFCNVCGTRACYDTSRAKLRAPPFSPPLNARTILLLHCHLATTHFHSRVQFHLENHVYVCVYVKLAPPAHTRPPRALELSMSMRTTAATSDSASASFSRRTHASISVRVVNERNISPAFPPSTVPLLSGTHS